MSDIPPQGQTPQEPIQPPTYPSYEPGTIPPPQSPFPQQPPAPGYPTYPQGGYVPPAPAYGQPYSMGYVAPPPSYLAAPPASGSLVQAWFSTAVKFSRDNISSWMKASKGSWVAIYLVVLGIFTGFTGALTIYRTMIVLADTYTRLANSDTTNNPDALLRLASFLRDNATIGTIIGSIVLPVFSVLGIYYSSWFLALFAPKEMGTVGVRLATIMRATAVTSFVPSVLGLVTAIVSFVLAPNILLTNDSGLTSTNPLIGLALNLVSLLFGIYGLAIALQAGATATTLSRWAVFGIRLLGGFILGIVITLLVVCPTILLVVGTIRSAS